MIIRKKSHWFRMLFVWKGSVLPRLLPRLTLLFIFTCVVVYFRKDLDRFHGELSANIYTVFGIALAIFLGFRNTVSYDRYWEGRKLWGMLLNDARTMARQLDNFIPGQQFTEQRHSFVKQMTAMIYALNHQLRGSDPLPQILPMIPTELKEPIVKVKYKPVYLLREMGRQINQWREQKVIDSILQSVMEQSLARFSDSIGGCERIAGTPILFSYNVLLHRTIYIYCFLLPFGFAGNLIWYAPFIITFVAYTFTALEAIADELEDPFGRTENDLALDELSANIECSLAEMADMNMEQIPKADSFFIT